METAALLRTNAGRLREKVLPVIRPCRESKTGWASRTRDEPRDDKLNEHGPELNVFWIPRNRDWARPWSEKTKTGNLLIKEKTSGGGARTRWVTERITVRG